jgi:hypothetical protein
MTLSSAVTKPPSSQLLPAVVNPVKNSHHATPFASPRKHKFNRVGWATFGLDFDSSNPSSGEEEEEEKKREK